MGDGQASPRPYKVVPVEIRARAIEEYVAGEDLVSVGRRHGVSKSTIHRWVRMAGHETRSPAIVNPIVPRRRGIPPKSADAVRMYMAGASSTQVADAFGVTPPTVLSWVRRLGHVPRDVGPMRRPLSASQLIGVDMYQNGQPAWRVAAELGVATNTVLNWVRRAGHEVRPRGHGDYRRSPHDGVVARKAVAAYLGGSTASQVAASIGVSPNTVLNWVRRESRSVRPRGRSPRRRPTTAA
jgi:transposase-like protein